MKKLALLLFMTSFISCKSPESKKAIIEKDTFGVLENGTVIDRYTLTNSRGMRVQIITYGGIITSVEVPNSNGQFEDVVLGYDNIEDYESNNPYFGALIGRFGNRISNGNFKIGDEEYFLAKNDGKNHLHGGEKGFDKVVWTGDSEIVDGNSKLKLTYLSPDMEEGYPGNLFVEVTYILTQENSIEIEYKATTDKATIINLTQHTYFNLSSDESILDHELFINADSYLPVDETLIPTGEIINVIDTPFDFTKSKTIGQDINLKNDQLDIGLGYDHCWVLNDKEMNMKTAAILSEFSSGIVLEIKTNEPAIQFYSGNFLNGSHPKKSSDDFYGFRSGLCLETQHFPNSPNQKNFPSVVLNPEDVYESKTIFKFSTK
jgi:aldose 1-epimerase